MLTAILVAGAATMTPANDTEDVWATLDRDVELLTASLAQGDSSGPKLGGFMRTLWTQSGDFLTGGEDTSGASVPNARIKLTGDRSGYDYVVQYDVSSSTLLDAFIDFPVGGVSGRMGMFKPPAMRAGLLSPKNLVFATRSVIGGQFAARQSGGQLSGNYDQLNWFLALQNGADGLADEYFMTARATFDFAGEGGAKGVEGCYGGPEEIGGTAAIAFVDDGSVPEGTSVGFEAYAGTSVYSFSVQYMDFGETGATAKGVLPGVGMGGLGAEADSSPLILSGTYMIQPDAWEAAVRLQDLDDANDTSVIDLAVSQYLDGHNLKWGFQYSQWDSDAAASDGGLFLIQLVLGY